MENRVDILFFAKLKKKNKKNLAPIYARLVVNQDRYEFSTGFSIDEKLWNGKVTEIDSLISGVQQRDDLQNYLFIEGILESLKEYILSRYKLVRKLSPANKTTTSNPSLKWMGKINILTTLFYDLIHGKESKDKSKKIAILIDASPKEIEDFILNNFLDENGQPFSRSTINTNLKPSKQAEKRAKGDIVIELSKI